MSDYLSIIKELITFYIKTNYEKYLVDNEIATIPTEQINNVVDKLQTRPESILVGSNTVMHLQMNHHQSVLLPTILQYF